MIRSVTKSIYLCTLALLSIFVFASGTAKAQSNIIADGNFNADTLSAAWSSFVADFAGVSAEVGVADSMAVINNISGAGGETWHIQFNQILTADQIGSLETGATYTISFDAKSSEADRPIRVYFGEDGGGFAALIAKDTTLSTEMTTYTMDVDVSAVFSAMKLGFEIGKSNGDVMIDNVSLRRKVDNIIIAGDFSADTLSANWAPFIADFAGVGGSVGVQNGEAAVTDLSGAGGATWHVQLNQVLTASQIGMLEQGALYTVSFDARSPEDGRPVRMYFGEEGGGFAAVHVEDVELSGEMETYTAEFEVGSVYSAMKLGFEMGLSNADVFIDNVYLFKSGSGEAPEPNEPFGDNRILFVDGPDLSIPRIDGDVVNDAVEPGNKVHRITGGAWFQNGFFWDMGGTGGVDFTENINSVDTVYFRVRINPADHTSEDTGTRVTGALTLSDVTNNTNSNLQWGISWPFPAEAYNNEWHEYAVPLPKPTIAAHDSALKDLDLDGNPLPEAERYSELQKLWRFDTAWNGSRDVSPNDEELGGDPDWDKLGRIAVSLGNDRSGTFYLDDFYIGSAQATDLNAALELPDAPGSVNAEAVDGTMNISWSHDASTNIYAYDLYYSGAEIADLEAEGVNKIGTYLANAALNFEHEVHSPHPGDVNHEYHYALVPTTVFGVSDPSVFTSTSVLAQGEITPYIFELSADQEADILSDLDNGEITGAGWPEDMMPFELGDETGAVAAGDASAKVWMGFGRSDNLNTVYIYVEAMDDDILAGPGNAPADMYGTTLYPDPTSTATWIPTINDNDPSLEWNYYLKDQIKFNFGTYDVNYVSGTPNKDRSRGERPDYFLSLQPKIDGNNPGMPDGMLTRFWVTEPNTDNPDVDYNTEYYSSNHLFTYTAVYENMMEGETRVGWKALMAFDANDLLVATEGGQAVDAAFEFPAADEIKYLPMTIELTDKDSGDEGNWWEVSSHVFTFPTAIGGSNLFEWTDDLNGLGVVAMAGSEVSTSSEDIVSGLPVEFELEQNFPNPFNPTTNIRFALPSASNVALEVYNVLGQRVATLISNEKMSAGRHSVKFDASQLGSGMYIYRIQAGNNISTKKMMLIK